MADVKKLIDCRIAIAGVTGTVGTAMLALLAEHGHPVEKIAGFATAHSAGKSLQYGASSLIVKDASALDRSFDLLFGFCSNAVTKQSHDLWHSLGAIVIDNSSAYRMDPDVPLIVPEVNPHATKQHRGWIANPNCSTIQMVRALRPLLAIGIEEISVATYQSVSGSGRGGLAEWEAQRAGSNEVKVFRERIDANVVPWIASPDEEGNTFEETKMRNETRKIFELLSLPVQATCVRVPVAIGHGEAVHLKLLKPLDRNDLIEILRSEPGLVVRDELAGDRLPTPLEAVGSDDVFVGRIRSDREDRRRVSLWVVADNVRVGAVTNAYRIAQLLFS